MNKMAIFSLVAVTVLFTATAPFIDDDSEGVNNVDVNREDNRYNITKFFDVPVNYITSDSKSSDSRCLDSVTKNLGMNDELSSVSEGAIFIDKSWAHLTWSKYNFRKQYGISKPLCWV